MTALCLRGRAVSCRKSVRGFASAASGSLTLMAMLVLLLIGAMPANGQKASPEPQRTHGRMENAVREMGADKRMKKMSEERQWDVVEFVTGNMLFVAFHELGHRARQPAAPAGARA